MGRARKKLTKEQAVQVEALAAFLTVEQIADYFGIGRRTFYDIMERDADVSARYKKGSAEAIRISAQGLMEKVRDGNITAIIFHLKTRGGWRENDSPSLSNVTASVTVNYTDA